MPSILVWSGRLVVDSVGLAGACIYFMITDSYRFWSLDPNNIIGSFFEGLAKVAYVSLVR